MSNELQTNRRHFLRRAAGAAGASLAFPHIVPSSAFGLDGAVAPSDRVALGFIGVGTMGQAHLRPFIYQPDVQVVAVCDPNRWRREQAQHIVNGEYNKQVCAAYNDFRDWWRVPTLMPSALLPWTPGTCCTRWLRYGQAKTSTSRSRSA